MDADARWQAFACTGNILRYLDYRQQNAEQPAVPAGEDTDGYDRNNGARPAGDPVQRG